MADLIQVFRLENLLREDPFYGKQEWVQQIIEFHLKSNEVNAKIFRSRFTHYVVNWEFAFINFVVNQKKFDDYMAEHEKQRNSLSDMEYTFGFCLKNYHDFKSENLVGDLILLWFNFGLEKFDKNGKIISFSGDDFMKKFRELDIYSLFIKKKEFESFLLSSKLPLPYHLFPDNPKNTKEIIEAISELKKDPWVMEINLQTVLKLVEKKRQNDQSESETGEQKRYCFYKVGDQWKIQFEEESIMIYSYKGAQIVHILLRRPWVKFAQNDIDNLIKPKPDSATSAYLQMAVDGSRTDGQISSPELKENFVMDGQSYLDYGSENLARIKKEYQEEIERLKVIKIKLLDQGKKEEAEKVKADIKAIEKELTTVTRSPKRYEGAIEKARRRLKKNFDDFCDALNARDCLRVAEYLSKNIFFRKGKIEYRPDPQLPWDLDGPPD